MTFHRGIIGDDKITNDCGDTVNSKRSYYRHCWVWTCPDFVER
jgi:hypothetical protein